MLTEQQQQQQQQPPQTLANRSFLYRSNAAVKPTASESSETSSSSSCLINETTTIVYATLDSLALRSKTLQLSAKQEPDTESHNVECAVVEHQMPEASTKLTHEVTELRHLPGYTFPGDKKPGAKKKNKGKDGFAFARNVLHYVPVQSRRYYRKSRNLATKSLSSLSQQQQQLDTRARKCKSLSRDELKYIDISAPSNFVHLDSGSRYLESAGTEGSNNVRASSQYAEIALDSSIFLLNRSFVWQQIEKLKLDQHQVQSRVEECDLYDDVGPPITQQETQECKAAEVMMASAELVEEFQEEQEVYDDVGPPMILQEEKNEEKQQQYEADEEDQVYDDVGPLRSPEVTTETDNQETYEIPDASIEESNKVDTCQIDNDERKVEEDVYDDVGPALVRDNCELQQSLHEDSHERVNSLYAGSLQLPYDSPNASEKLDSEWEDLDEPVDSDGAASPPRKPTTSESPKKKGPRWSCKIRRQRSKASRKSSARSTSRNSRSHPAVARGSLLEHDSSDDSNYETLQTYEPDDFSSSSDDDDDNNNKDTESTISIPQQQPPSRPIPPPPREESLGHSLGRRMKMLRRTWSITKGSLGRMRRRASGEMSGDDASNTYDPRKYFSFKRPFGKSQQGGGASSTFYLDKSLSSEGGSEKESACSSGNENEPIYGNAHWYKQVGLYDEQMQRSQTSIDHYSVLAEEPLYQFYAANATRNAFESDSDGYEEVEELTPSSVTTDLARPGHRTLWCQTPQVINSGLLQRLTMEERKIQEAKFEIVTSEASYLNSLRVLENEFASNYELVQEVLTAHEREKLFGGVPDVLVASERFLAELENIWREDPMLPRLAELLLRHADKCAHVYVDYCSNQVDIDSMLKELKAKKGYKYLEAVSRIESQPACHSLSLHSFLMLPMQRITRLPLLADAVLSKLSVEHTERLSWERVLAELSQVVARCNEAARLAERRNEMDALARKLEYPAKVPPVELRDRELIRSGTVVQLSSKADTEYKLTFGKKFHKTPLMLMLLTDYLLVTKLKSNSNEETYSVMETCKRIYVALESAPEDGGPLAGRHAMLLTLLENQAGRQVELVLSCDSDTERERWLDAVSPPKPSCLGETLYESWDCPQVMAVYSYSARQPDEIALQPGDVINVLRKMNDGWLFGEKLLDGEQGWFPGNFTKEVASEHVRARNLRQRHRFLALSGSVLQRKAKQSLSLL